MDKNVPPEKIRVSDAQRLVAVELLGRGLAAGCLSAAEFDERAAAAWAAATRGELAATTADLPPLPLDPVPPGRAEQRRLRRPHSRATWLGIAAVVLPLLLMIPAMLAASTVALLVCAGLTLGGLGLQVLRHLGEP